MNDECVLDIGQRLWYKLGMNEECMKALGMMIAWGALHEFSSPDNEYEWDEATAKLASILAKEKVADDRQVSR